MNTLKNLVNKVRRNDGHAAWRKTYAAEIAQIRSRANAQTTSRSTAA